MILNDIIAKMSVKELLNIRNYGKTFCFTDWYKNNAWHPLVVAKYGSCWWMSMLNLKQEEQVDILATYIDNFGKDYPDYSYINDVSATRESLLKLVEEKLEQQEIYTILNDLGHAVSSEFLSLYASIIYSEKAECWAISFDSDMYIALENSELVLNIDKSYYSDLTEKSRWVDNIYTFKFKLSDPDYVSKLCDAIRTNHQTM